ncbi:MAG: hypothetical protein R3F59_32865 [Myxococcota bacterium]
MWTLFALAACQEPFGTDRHDLTGFRIAAVALPAAAPGDPVRPRAALIVDGRPWSETAVDLRWTWLADPDALATLDPDAPADGVGPAPVLTLPADRPILGLVARQGARVARAYAAIPPPAEPLPPLPPPEIAALPLTVGEVTAEQLQRDARLDLTGADGPVAPGGFARFTAPAEGDPLVRWMATAGTFFELDRQRTDWAAGDLWLDGDEIDDETVPREDLPPGWVTVLALALGDGGEGSDREAPSQTTFAARDLAVGLPDPVGVWVAGRFLPSDAPPPAAEQLRGTLQADDDAPSGLRLVGLAAEPLGTPGPDLPCDPPLALPFDPAVLLDQRCSRAALDGAEVTVIPADPR